MHNSTGSFRRELLPPPAAFYAKELGKLSRPSRGWARGNCPFHKSESKTSFSVNLDTGGFYCFGCNVKGGDVLSFVMKRDHLDFITAAKSLGAWSVISSTTKAQLARERKAREEAKAKQLAEAEQTRQERIAVRDWLHLLERIYKQANNRLSEVRQARTEKFPGECQLLWEMLSDCLPLIELAEAEYFRLAGVGGE